MCRFVAYMGERILLADLLMRSNRSLIRQSFDARERKEPLNGDGFGVGWYDIEIEPSPCVFTSITPAWSNRNLQRLADKIYSRCMFAHVRAASPGTLVSEVNCHPFQFDRYLWMHNGRIAQFSRIKRRLRESLSDDVYDLIQGTSDSEHAFAVFLDLLRPHQATNDASTLGKALGDLIEQLLRWSSEAKISEASYLNFAVTSGDNIIVSRFVYGGSVAPHSLYVSTGARFEALEDSYRMKHAQPDRPATTVIIASEPLIDAREDWEPVPPNHIVQVDRSLNIEYVPLT